jgi:hypothetical protein
MKSKVLGAVALCVLWASVAGAQTFAEQLQRAIYTQAAVGDLDAAIRMYQQIVGSAPANSDAKIQAERLLAAAEAYRRVPRPPVLATFDGRTYKHTRTSITFNVPSGWNVGRTYPSSDDGEQVMISINDPSAEASAWMIPETLDDGTIEQRLYTAPLVKLRQRGQPGYINFPNWMLREGSTHRTTIGGRRAVEALADYKVNDRAMVEAMVWVFSNQNRAFFALRVAAADFDRLKPQFDAMVASAKLP